jgi:hypothetical protein
LEPGAYVAFGAYSDKDLVWQVTSLDSNGVTLLCTEAVADKLFSADGINAWASSSLRQWLGTAFLSDFSESERARLLFFDNTVLLSRDLKKTASSGNRDFYFSPFPSLASSGYNEAYQTVVRDTVTLPDIDLISSLAESGADITLDEAYWLETPYFNNTYLARCVMPDGSILIRETAKLAGVRPVIHITAVDIASGSGAFSDPFILN